MRRWIAIYCLFCVGSISAIFEDQVGKADWYHAGIGLPKHVSLHHKKGRLMTATDADLIASLHLRDGEIQWRQKLDTPATHLFFSQFDGLIVSINDEGKTFRSWNAMDGTVRWEFYLQTKPEAVFFIDEASPKVLIFSENILKLMLLNDASIQWEYALDALQECRGKHFFSKRESMTVLISVCR